MILTVHNCTFSLGPEKRGMAKLDSAINQLDAYFYREQNRGTFNELDALILALKRKIVQLGSHGRDAETLPLSRLIIERLDDYGKLTLADNLMVQAVRNCIISPYSNGIVEGFVNKIKEVLFCIVLT